MGGRGDAACCRSFATVIDALLHGAGVPFELTHCEARETW